MATKFGNERRSDGSRIGINGTPDYVRRAGDDSALQTEWSLWTRDAEVNGVLDTVRELGIGFVAYSPLGRGALSGAITSVDDLAPDDFRRHHPPFQQENLARLDEAAPVGSASGDRYADMSTVDG